MSEDEAGLESARVPPNAIAIIGMAGRFPGARDIRQFWRNLHAGVESITRFMESELEDCFPPEVRRAPNFVKSRPILENPELFDAEFFGMHTREAELTDPQHRLLLECAWEALEDGGYDPAAYQGAIGVFAGSSINTYFLNNVCADRRTIEEFASNYQVGSYPMLLGASPDFLATRISYRLNLRGPSVTVQSACSTSLLAVAQACQSLLLFQSDMVLAGGVSITFPQKRGYQHLEGGMVSADGHCRPFDAAASGTVFGSGAGVVLLKRLEDAVADGDHIYAVVRGCGISNDGATKVGFTAPSVQGESAAIEMALAIAGVEARTISFVECHGTATPLGDPIEVAGLTQAFGADPGGLQFCALGSVKGNIGHLDAAAGIAGFIKTALALYHRKLPATLHYRQPNPQIRFETTPFFVNATLSDLFPHNGPLRAGVSAFGVGGTNVHAVLEERPFSQPHAADPLPALIVLSARTESALDALRTNLASHLRSNPQIAPPDVAYTLQVGRRRFAHRISLVCRDRISAIAQLEAARARPETTRPEATDIVFLFPGQGSQYPDMARGLYEQEPEFARHVDTCLRLLAPALHHDLRAVLYPRDCDPAAGELLMSTASAQPALFAIEFALAQLWMSWGLRPQAMVGHSVGEFVAAVLAEVMTLEDALAIVAARGQLMQHLPRGAMLAVRLPESQLSALLGPELAIAAINGPALCVASGPRAAIEALETELDARAVMSRRLHTSHGFHSAMVDPVVEPLRQRLAQIRLGAPKLPFISCVSGTWIRPEQATSPEYWAQHARLPVRFADGIEALTLSGSSSLLEVGPGTTLTTLARQSTKGRGICVINSLPDSAREVSDMESMLAAAGQLWEAGATPDWERVHPAPHQRVPLPGYPFERKAYWISPAPRAVAPVAAVPTTETPAPRTEPAAAPARSSNSDTSQNPMNDGANFRATIASILEDLSGERPESTDSAVTFLEMGYDSLFLTQVAQKIQSQLKVKITFRQLLSEYSTIPALAEFLGQSATAPAKPVAGTASAPAPASGPDRSGPSAPSGPALPLGGGITAPAGLESLFRDQLQAMSQLISRQFEMLQASAPNQASPAAPISPLPSSAPLAVTPEPPTESRPSRFQVYKPAQQATGHQEISAEHRRHIADLSRRYTTRTARSRQLTQDYRRVLADPRAAAGFRLEWKEMVYPIVCARCAGSKLWDVDGNEYVDLVNGYGQTAFGHAPDFVVQAVKDQLDRGFAIGPQTELAGSVATAFAELTGNERVTFCNTGSEAVMAAMRVARTVTGRDKIVIFNGDYHGQFDEVLVKGVQRGGAAPRSMPVAPGIPASAVQNMVVLDYATPATLQWLRENAQDLAAVIVEPVQSRHPDLQPFEFLREVRQITEASGTAFVLDEVVTGFRVHPGGIQAISGVRADLATYGKVVGGGLPIGILAGKSRFMDALDGGQWHYGDDSIPEVGVTFFAGTFVRHPLALAAASAVLKHIKTHGPDLQERLAAQCTALVAELNLLFAEYGLVARAEHYASWFYFNVHSEHPLAALLFYHLRLRGVHVQDGFPCFITTAHSEADLRHILTAFRESLQELRAVGILGTHTAPERAAAPSPRRLTVPLTESQLEIWLSAQMGDAATSAFNESVTLHLRGQLNARALQGAIDQVIARHEALRATFSPTGEEMRITPALELKFPTFDLTSLPAEDAHRELQRLLDQDAHTPFDLVDGPVIRAMMVKLAPEVHAFVLTAHHIICDGWSFNVIASELGECYAALCQGTAPTLREPLSFSSYALAQQRRAPAELASTEAYWLREFAEPVQPLELPTDRTRPAIKSYNGASRCHTIKVDLYQSIKKASGRAGNTLFVTLLAAFHALIGRLCDQEEVVVGVPTAGQSMLEDEILVGHCVNFLPLRARWSTQTSVRDYLATSARRVLDAYEHQNYTLGTLVRKLGLPRGHNRVPLAEIQFNLERLADRMQLPGLEVEVTPNAKAYVNFDLFLNIIESSDGLRLDCDYNTDLFDASTIDQWLDYYQNLLAAMAADMTQPLYQVSFLPAAERALLLYGFNATAVEYPRNLLVHQLFEAHASANPNAIAAQFGAETLSYAALDRRANQLAHRLRGALQDQRGDFVPLIGICVERSLEMLIAVLAVLKAGCAYVPLDPSHPAARLTDILSEADVAAVVCDGLSEGILSIAGKKLLDVRSGAHAIATKPVSPPEDSTDADRLAYVIYTSGSTGKPKGVEITHRAVVNFLHSMARKPGIGPEDVLLAVTTLAFDIAGLELLLPLVSGAKVVIAASDELGDGFRLLRHLEEVGATMMQATPSTWRLLVEAGFRPRSGFRMLCGGEALPADLASTLAAGDGELWNMYGPTETTIWSSCARLQEPIEPITVGAPIANTQFYILDRHDQPMPHGIAGQLHIGGDGVAGGYYRRPELTREKFIPNPFAPGRMYRTGDLARWLPDGRLQVLGRIDHQIKLRGFRIELGEIEAVLTQQAQLSAATVLLRQDLGGPPRLVAYYVERPGEPRTTDVLQATLSQHLPDYMVPGVWVRLESLPLTPNGKLDRTALPLPNGADLGHAAFVAPQTAIESTLAGIWSEVLVLERVSVTDDLLKLGADSIQLFQITARANRAGIALTAKQLLQHRTIGALAALVDQSTVAATPSSLGLELPSLANFRRARRGGSASGPR